MVKVKVVFAVMLDVAESTPVTVTVYVPFGGLATLDPPEPPPHPHPQESRQPPPPPAPLSVPNSCSCSRHAARAAGAVRSPKHLPPLRNLRLWRPASVASSPAPFQSLPLNPRPRSDCW